MTIYRNTTWLSIKINNLLREIYMEKIIQIEKVKYYPLVREVFFLFLMRMLSLRMESDKMEVYSLMKRALDVSQLRSETIANNIANVNTANYKRKYVTFEETLNEVNKLGKIDVKVDNSTSLKVDGNNVDLESEKVNQAANTLMFNGLVSLTNTKLSMAKSVITGRQKI